MSTRNKLVIYIIDVAWDELFCDEEYDVDKLTDDLNKEIKRIKKDIEDAWMYGDI